MDSTQRDLHDRIETFHIDPGPVALPFAARLARENGWSSDYAGRVVREYKRFIFLAAAAGHPVAPSDQVDQAWHLHMVYTRSYWDGLCRGVLGGPLHHGPTTGGPAEGTKFNDWYARTLESYRRFFRQVPPADIWPAPEVRFTARQRFVRIDAARHWIVPKPRAGQAAFAGAGAVALAALAGCSAAASGGIDPIAAIVLGAAGLLVFFIFLVYLFARLTRPGRGGRGESGGCGWMFGGGDGDSGSGCSSEGGSGGGGD